MFYSNMALKPEPDASVHFKVLQTKAPNLAQQVELFWGKITLSSFITTLFRNTPNGFPRDITDALLGLSKANVREHPELRNLAKDALDGHSPIWGRNIKVL